MTFKANEPAGCGTMGISIPVWSFLSLATYLSVHLPLQNGFRQCSYTGIRSREAEAEGQAPSPQVVCPDIICPARTQNSRQAPSKQNHQPTRQANLRASWRRPRVQVRFQVRERIRSRGRPRPTSRRNQLMNVH
jgi:hypothetical protein